MNRGKRAIAVALAAWLVAAGWAAQGANFLYSTENVARIRVGATTAKEVRELLGEPFNTRRDARRGWNGLEYRVFQYGERSVLWVSVSDDGVVREVIQLRQKSIAGAS